MKDVEIILTLEEMLLIEDSLEVYSDNKVGTKRAQRLARTLTRKLKTAALNQSSWKE